MWPLDYKTAINPLHVSDTDLHEAIMGCVRTVIGEKMSFLISLRGKAKLDVLTNHAAAGWNIPLEPAERKISS